LIEALALPVEIFHYNEGHPAFHLLAHLHHHIQKGASLPAAQELVRAATLFTTHTPAPAGHDAFPPELLRRYIGGFVVQQLNLRWEEFLRWGEMPDQPDRFSLTAFCLRFAARTNAVSQLHTKVSQRMFAGLYPSYLPAEVPIDGVTNGVHVSTWQAPEWQRSKRSWETHQTLKTHLLNFLKRRLSGHPWPVAYLRSVQAFFASTDENTLLLGFARRFATYKRHLLLLQSEEFSELLSAQPVRLIIAGKAHPQDEAGKAALREAWRKTLQPPLLGKVLFIPDYDMHIARLLVQGVDVWVNLPVYGQEASGTSGMKACLNGVLHFSLPDGWWAEVPAEEAGGWAIPPCQTAEAAIRDAWEATQAVYLLQESVLPAYQSRDAKGLPTEWIHRMEKAQRYAKEHFSTQRMLREYEENLYSPLSARLHKLKADPARFKERLSLLEQIDEAWSHLTIRRVWMPPFVERSQPAGTPFSVGVEVESTDIPAEALRAEIVFQPARGTPYTFPLPQVAPQTYAGEIVLPDPGVYHYAIRLYAWDPYLEERLWAWAKLF
jgi:glucan phosphorylase